jgi:hypothetical protein
MGGKVIFPKYLPHSVAYPQRVCITTMTALAIDIFGKLLLQRPNPGLGLRVNRPNKNV